MANKIQKELTEKFPNIGKIEISLDTLGSIATCCKSAGVVLIAGTGSNCLVVDENRKTVKNCGGWGHFFGDDGSGFHLVKRCVEIIYRKRDGLVVDYSEYKFLKDQSWYKNDDITKVEKSLNKYFEISKPVDIIPHMFPPNFSKSKFAAFSKNLAQLARDPIMDPFARFLFYESGTALAKHVLSFQNLYTSIFAKIDGIVTVDIVCEGGHWNTWDLLRVGFRNCLKDNCKSNVKFRLLRTKTSAALGAARLAAEAINKNITLNFSENTQLLEEIILNDDLDSE